MRIKDESDKDKSLEDFAEDIIKRFPIGTESEYLIKHYSELSYKKMINHLLLIASGNASNQRYRSEAAMIDAQEFIDRLEAWHMWTRVQKQEEK